MFQSLRHSPEKVSLFWILKKCTVYLIFILFAVGYSRSTNSNIPANIPTEFSVNCYSDAWGVPFIDSKTENDAFFVQGYVTARDRFFQLDITRRKFQGRLSEIGGENYIQSDIEALKLNYNYVAKETWNILSDQSKQILQSYSDGVNYYLKTHIVSCIELAFGPKPDNWQPIDCIGIGLLTNWTMTEDYYITQDWQKIRLAIDNERFLELFNSDCRSTTSQLIQEDKYKQNVLPKYQNFLSEIVKSSPLMQKEKMIGSNCAVISGSRTVTGKPLLFNDPHLDIYYPSIWYEIDMNIQNQWHVHGVSIVGVPGVIIGSNSYFGWGITLLGADQIDIYQFPINPQNPNQYQYNNQWFDFTTENYELKIGMIGKKTIDKRSVVVKRTLFGPVIFESNTDHYIQVLRWVGLEPAYDFESFINILRSKTFTDFRKASSYITSSINLLYADVEGNIAYQAVGKVPLRYTDGRWVLWGPDPGQHWQGYVDFNDLPYCLNPPRGYIVSANNQIFDNQNKDSEFILQGYRSNGYRALQIENAIKKHSKITKKELSEIFFDNKSEFFLSWIKTLCKELENTDEFSSKEIEIKNLLDNWDGNFNVDQAEPVIAALFIQNLYELVLKPKGIHYLSLNAMDSLIKDTNLDEWWWKPKESPDENLDYRRLMINRAFKKSCTELIDKYSDNLANWKWGKLHYITLSTYIPFLKKFSPGRVPSPGGIDSVNQGSYTFNRNELTFPQYFGTSLRLLIDFRDPSDLIYMNIPGGQSSNPLFTNSNDQVELWKHGKLKNLVIN